MSNPNAAPVPNPNDPRYQVDVGRYWAGVGATVIVAALIGLVGVVIIDNVFDIGLAPLGILTTGTVMTTYVVHGALAGLLAGALLFLLIKSTPRPLAFFGWIMALATAVAAALPFSYAEIGTALATAILNLIIGIAVWSLLAGVARMTTRLAAIPTQQPPAAPPAAY